MSEIYNSLSTIPKSQKLWKPKKKKKKDFTTHFMAKPTLPSFLAKPDLNWHKALCALYLPWQVWRLTCFVTEIWVCFIVEVLPPKLMSTMFPF